MRRMRLRTVGQRGSNHGPVLDRRRFCLAALAGAIVAGSAAAADFDDFIAEVRRDALEQGVSRGTLDRALAGLQPIARILQLDKAQPERKVGFAEYLERTVNGYRIRRGRAKLSEHGPLLAAIGDAYGVEPRFIVSLWGMETDYGGYTGGFPVIGSLATLAFDGRRSFFRRELIHALRIVEEGHVRLEDMTGSWAGAMGQAQFLPSSFRAYAVDYDGDGRRDIWLSTGDVLASIANYLKEVGWRSKLSWGQQVRLPPDFAAELASIEVTRPVGEWLELGVVPESGASLPQGEVAASIVRPGGARGPAYLVTENYRAIMRWNRSLYFATATGHLADRLAEA